MGNELYRGREHSLIKHELLKGYLEKLLFIVGCGGVKEITYVDCFAGPWGDESETLEGTSIAISLGILNKVREALAAKHHIYDARYRAVFVEQDESRYEKLKIYLKNNCPSRIEYHHLRGDYTEVQDKIIEHCGNGFAFFFIDPKGWTPVGIPKLSKLLERPASEFMITFMYDFLVRAVRIEELRSQVGKLLGKIDNSEIEQLWNIDQYKREEQIVRRYRERLKALMPGRGKNKPRSYHATVLDKDKERTKYHMVYLTSHPKGIIEFSGISEKVEIFQRRVRHQRKEEASGQPGLFPIKDADFQEAFAADINDVKEYWLNILSDKPTIFTEVRLADMLEETGWLESDIQAAFGKLIKEGKAENLSAQKKRRARFVHFKDNELLRRCI